MSQWKPITSALLTERSRRPLIPLKKPDPKPEPSEVETERREALKDEALTLHAGALFMMAPHSEG
jgi:hypothetical protein